MNINTLLGKWRREPTIASNFSAWKHFPARQAAYSPFPADLNPDLQTSLMSTGIHQLYEHQSQVFLAAQHGENVVITTGTASGKTLAYNLVIFDAVLKDPTANALYLFPTKALAQDQLASIKQVTDKLQKTTSKEPRIRAAVYDGDTPSSQRSTIRKNSRLILTNPDMLHAGILPYHTRWNHFFKQLRFVVIDEMHTYRGVFGSHIANVLRRLRRISHFYGANPQFILTSATIRNPQELAEGLVEAPVSLISDDGSEHGDKHFIIYNPPVVDHDLGLRKSALQEALRLLSDLQLYQLQTLVFVRSRRSVEMLLRQIQQEPGDETSFNPSSIKGYRSGYLAGERRQIEAGLRNGTTQTVIATNALELGIDIGGVTAAIMVGFPGSIAAAWQQAGRAGRHDEPSIALLLASANPIDQFIAHHPEYFFEESPEQALLNPDHPVILMNHIQCALYELPFAQGEAFGALPAEVVSEYLEYLSENSMIQRSGGLFHWASTDNPAHRLSLRNASPNKVVLYGDNGVIGEIDQESALWMVHPQAIYLHQAHSYLVQDLDLEHAVAKLSPVETDYYTEPLSETNVSLQHLHMVRPINGGNKFFGELLITNQVVGFRKIRWNTQESLGSGNLDLPPSMLQTTGFWFSLNPTTVDVLRSEGLWSNDPNRYGPNWNDQRSQARLRDQYRCQVCGVQESDRTHHVHHKIPFRSFSSYLEANDLANLITVCPACHRRIETAVRIRSGLSGLGFIIGHLAPLFLLCDWNDIGVHSDPNSPLAEGSPAVIVYDRIPGGIGFSKRLYEIHMDVLRGCFELITSCACKNGCPSCVGPGGEQGAGSKLETLAILSVLTDSPLPRLPADNS